MPDLEIDVRGLIDGAITQLEAAKPEMLELDAFKSDKAALMRELAALRGEIDAHKNALAVRQFTIAELDRKIASAQDELKTVQNDLARHLGDFERLRKLK
jgi:predicted  nucleic acid-binding Zn-ribbon protein